MHSILPRAAGALAAVLLLSFTPDTADAQLLKRIKRAAGEAAAEAAGRKAADAVIGPEEAKPAAARSASPTSPSGVVEITTDGIDAFLVSLEPVLAALEQRRALEAAEQRMKQYEQCIQGTSATLAATPPSPENIERASPYLEPQSEVAQQMAEALQRGDEARAAVLQDSMQVLNDKYLKAMYPALSKCGERPRPVLLTGAQRDALTTALPKRPEGMSATEYGRLRERIALWLLTEGAQGNFNDAERAALAARQSQLAPLAPLFKSGQLEWSSWYDLNQAWR